MNLNCNRCNLFQTPTHITYMCMTCDDGEIHFELNGKKAIAPLMRYIQYYKDCCLSSGKISKDDEEYMTDRIAEIMKVCKKKDGELKVWVS